MAHLRKPHYYYGWNIVFALAITETISWGILYYAFTVFLTPMEQDLGWSRAELTGGFSLMLLMTGAMAFFVGTWIDRHGSRGLMTVGSILASLLVVAWSQVTDRTHFYLIWAGLGVCAATVWYEPAFAVVAAWFVRRRGRALATITFAAGLASTIFIPLSEALRTALGWRDAVLALGILLAVTTIPLHAVVLRRHPADLGLLPDGDNFGDESKTVKLKPITLGNALNSRFFWMLTLAFSLAGLAMSAIRVHFIPFLTDSGIDSGTAALASGAIGIMQVAGRLVFSPIEERLSIRLMVGGIFALQAAAILVLLFGLSPFVIIVFVIIFGATVGAQTLARASIIAETYGATHYGRISSVMSIFLTLAGTAAPVGASLIHDRFDSYIPVLWIMLLLAIFSVGVMAFTRSDTVPEVATA